MKPTLRPARLRPGDVARLGAVGLRSRPLRGVLSALGIAIGIAAMLSVVGIASSSRADLDRTLARLGTNLLTVHPGQTLSGQSSPLPTTAVAMIGRVGPVESVAATGTIDANVYRNDHIPTGQTGGIAVLAASATIPQTVGTNVRVGTWFSEATDAYPSVVLGARAADLLGLRTPGIRVWLGGIWMPVLGILEPVPLVPELDSAAFVGWVGAERYLRFDGHPTTVYVRSVESQVSQVRSVLGATANPQAPHEVRVSRPSDALAAKRAADTTLNGLLLGLGSVALLVGGVGVANTMVISVLERRAEIGLRRSLGATRGQIRDQFLAESLLLSVLGGAAGVLLGVTVTAAYATTRHWPTFVPAWTMLIALGATATVGAVAGLYPAIRAGRLSPTEALTGP